jgi:hypothetical protein
LTGERKPVLTRHHQIEQNEIYRLARKHGAHASTVRSVAHLEALWTCLEKVESFPWMKGELDDEAEGIYARV